MHEHEVGPDEHPPATAVAGGITPGIESNHEGTNRLRNGEKYQLLLT